MHRVRQMQDLSDLGDFHLNELFARLVARYPAYSLGDMRGVSLTKIHETFSKYDWPSTLNYVSAQAHCLEMISDIMPDSVIVTETAASASPYYRPLIQPVDTPEGNLERYDMVRKNCYILTIRYNNFVSNPDHW